MCGRGGPKTATVFGPDDQIGGGGWGVGGCAHLQIGLALFQSLRLHFARFVLYLPDARENLEEDLGDVDVVGARVEVRRNQPAHGAAAAAVVVALLGASSARV